MYGEEYPSRLLQPDHRIPYEIGGDPMDMLNTDYFMMLSPSANRDKSWTCEHCTNWVKKDLNICKTCYYTFPETYQHITGENERKLSLVFKQNDIRLYDVLVKQAETEHITSQNLVKRMIKYFEQIHKNNEPKR